jgi:serine protease Do
MEESPSDHPFSASADAHPAPAKPERSTATDYQEEGISGNYRPAARVAAGRRPVGVATVFLAMVLTLLVGAIGGISGFVLLATSSGSPAVQNLQNRLGISRENGVSLPVKQSIRVEESSAVIDAAKKVSPAVVSITANAQAIDFFGQVSEMEIGGGTGFIITSDGLIVTNRHVVSRRANYQVVLNDGRILDATIKAVDTVTDFAVLKIEAKDLPTVEIGSSDALEIGQYVLAVGNALGQFKNSVTMGVVSAKNRKIEASGSGGSETLTDLIQTDAAINPGNSGGPLVNLKGQVVGINTAIASTTGTSIGVGFAIPIDSVRGIIDSVRRTGEIIRPYLGVRYVTVNRLVQRLNNLAVDYGALVIRGASGAEVAVIPEGPAAKAGIQENDILLEVNGERIDEENPLPKRIAKYQVGDEVTIKLRRGGEEQALRVKLERLPR